MKRFHLALGLALSASLLAACGKAPLVANALSASHLAARGLAWPPASMTASVETIAGGHSHADGGYVVDVPAAQARYNLPNGIAYANGRVYVSDARNNVITTLADRGGALFASSFVGTPNPPQDQDGTGAQATFTDPQDITATADGTLVLVEYHSDRVRAISPSGTSTTLVKATGQHPTMWGPYGIAAGASGTLYVSDLDRKQVVKLTRATNGNWSQTVLYRAKTDADPVPMGLTVDEHENVYWSSGYGLMAMDSNGKGLHTLVQRLPNFAWDLAYQNGHLAIAACTYVLDVNLANNQVQILAGQPKMGGDDGVGARASFASAASICFGEPDTLYVADGDNRRICRLTFH